MSDRMQLTLSQRMSQAVAAFRRASDGVVAIEFIFVLPILVMIYFGAFEGSKLYEVSRKANTATETIGDLVGRTRSVTKAELSNIFDIARAIISPFDDKQLDVRVTAVSIDAEGTGTVDWSRTGTGAGLPKGSDYEVPDELKANGPNFLIFVDADFAYTSPIVHSVVASALDITKQHVVIPRLTATIPCSDCG